MSLDSETATAVTGGDSPSGAVESTAAAPAPGGDEGIQTPDAVEAPVVAAEPATADSPEESATPSLEDVLKSIPEDDSDLEQANTRDVVGLRNQRAQLRVLEAAVKELQPLESLKSFAELGEPETVRGKVEAYDSLFSPVIDPATNQPVIDPATGFPVVSAAQFIERVDSENPGMAEQFFLDALHYKAEIGDGRKVPLYQLPAVQAEMLKACGLDPQRVDDYRNIDALSAPQDTGVTPEDLAEIPEEFHDTYKSLPPGIRADLKQQDDATRQFNLEVYKERADRKAAEAQAQQQATQERQQQEANARAHVAREQDSFVSQQLQESHAALMDDLASQVTFSDDAQTNALMHGVVGACVLALRDPDSSFATQKVLEALGVKADPGFYQALADADKHLRDAKAYELFGHQGFRQNALTAANNAKKQALAKAAPIALKIAKALGGQAVSKATKQNQALTGATRTRPVPADGNSGEEGNGILPAGMLPTDPRAGIYIARQAGLLGG